jgi:Ankyrin repeats (many copies)/UvrD-like helicase C-terminal domain
MTSSPESHPAPTAQRLPALVLRDLDVGNLAHHVKRAVEDLSVGNFRAADARKLKESGIYRARLDDTNRLLFKFGEHAGRRVLLVLEVVRNHAYDRARFLNGGSYTEADFEPFTTPQPVAPSEQLRFVHPTSTVLHVLDKPLSFDDAQEAVFSSPLPLIIVGSAGSGKTALTLEKLKTIPGQGVYLTRSSFLVESARSLYFANGYENAGQEVDFLSLRELVETIEVPTGREATWADFRTWYERMRGTFKIREAHKIYEEVKGVLTGASESGPHLNEEQYLALGVRQSIFLGDERRVVFQIFGKWLDHLRQNGLFDSNVVAWERLARAQPRYDFLFIDEVQDVTNVELRLALATLKDKRNFLLCGDSNQIVHPNLFSWARVKTLFHESATRGDSSELDIRILAANYRNTRAVTAIANRLLQIKQRRFGSIDRESNFLVECVTDEPGQVDLRADTPAIRREIDDKTRRSTRFAVIVLRDEDKPAAREAFSTPLVFSVHEAKGLEYENVILFRLLSSAPQQFRECAEGVSAGDLDGTLNYARTRDKTDKSLDAYKFYVNALYVAMTRAVKTLLIIESEVDHPLFELLTVKQQSGELVLERSESSLEDWQREARRLELQGKTEQAEQIRRDVLETQPVPWTVFSSNTLATVRERALGAEPRDKAMQQLLFEYAVTYDTPSLLPKLVEAGFRHARKVESGLEFIERTHYAPYQIKRSTTLVDQLRKYGVDFRNPLNETPLMVAARHGRADLVEDFLALGADPELYDNAGRTALRLAIKAFRDKKLTKRNPFEATYRLLARQPVKIKIASRMVKLDPSGMEWFLLNYCLVEYRQMFTELDSMGMPGFTAPMLETLFSRFPDAVLPQHRKKRAYLSAMLSKNELFGTSPYNRQLFLRVGHGIYVLNPSIEIGVRDQWNAVGDVMGLTELLETMGTLGQRAQKAWTELRTRTIATLEKAGRGS